MNSIDLFKMGVKNLWRRKTRTILTVLGVLIGTTAIVVMVSLGLGLEKAQMESMEQMGGLTEIEVHKPWTGEDDGRRSSNDSTVYMDEEAVALFRSLNHVEGVLATKNTNIQLAIGKKQSWSQILAVDFEDLQLFGYELAEGRWPDEMERNTFIAGANANLNFQDMSGDMMYYEEPEPVDLYNSSIKAYINGEYYGNGKKKRPFSIAITGTLASKMAWMDHTSYVSFYTYDQYLKQDQKKYGGQQERKRPGAKEDLYDSIKVKVDQVENVMAVQDEIKLMGYEAYSNAEYLDSEQGFTKVVQAVLGGIGGVSLLVAAIGITNTMIMSIYERTREIGVMKVLGAKLKDIKNLFLLEAALIGLFGGIMGLGLSFLGSHIINDIFFNLTKDSFMVVDEISYIPLKLSVAALVFSTVIGIISGYYPARRAMKLSALKAISTN